MFGYDQCFLNSEGCVIERFAANALNEFEDSVARDIVVSKGSDLVEFTGLWMNHGVKRCQLTHNNIAHRINK